MRSVLPPTSIAHAVVGRSPDALFGCRSPTLSTRLDAFMIEEGDVVTASFPVELPDVPSPMWYIRPLKIGSGPSIVDIVPAEGWAHEMA